MSEIKWSVPCDPKDWSTYVSKLEAVAEAARRAFPHMPNDSKKAVLKEMLSRLDWWAETKSRTND